MARQSLGEMLTGLRADIAHPARSAPEEPAQPSPDTAEIERQFAAVGEAIAEAVGNAEAGVKRYPLAAVAAAFLLGAVVGRLGGRL
jgi:hypothetical protein